MRNGKILDWWRENRANVQRVADGFADSGLSLIELKEIIGGFVDDQIPALISRADVWVDQRIDWSRVLPNDLGDALESADNSLVSDLVEMLCRAAMDPEARQSREAGLTVARVRSRYRAMISGGPIDRRPRFRGRSASKEAAPATAPNPEDLPAPDES